jgi:hypothetical protein
LAAVKSKLEASGKLWECANEELMPQESSNQFLLTKDNKERTAWQVAAKMGNVSLLKNLWEWAQERDKPTDELKQTLFLAKNLMGRTAWHDAAETKNTKLLDILREWGKEELTREELGNKLLLSKNNKQKKTPSMWQE